MGVEKTEEGSLFTNPSGDANKSSMLGSRVSLSLYVGSGFGKGSARFNPNIHQWYKTYFILLRAQFSFFQVEMACTYYAELCGG